MRQSALAALVGALVLGVASLGAAKGDLAEKMGHRPGPPGPPGSASAGRWHSAPGDMAEAFRKRRPKPEELKAKLEEFKKTHAERRAAHEASLRLYFGPRAFGMKEFRDELRVHARRMARLNRAKFVATTELDEPQRAKALTRIDKLLAAEHARHDKRMQTLRPPGPIPSGAPSGAPSAPSSAPVPAAPAGSAP